MVDTCLIAVSFWLAYELRASEALGRFFGTGASQISLLMDLRWPLPPAHPSHSPRAGRAGVLQPPMICRRRLTVWICSKLVFLLSLGLILALFFIRLNLPRSIVIWFGLIGVVLMMLKERIIRFALATSLRSRQLRRRFILLGDSGRNRAHSQKSFRLNRRRKSTSLAELDLDTTPLDNLVNLLH
jgi:hypothetical protein